MVGAKTGGLLQGTINTTDSSNNSVSDLITAAGFADAANFKYQLKATSPAVDAGIALAKTVRGYTLKPVYQYLDTASYNSRPDDGKIDIGAYEYLKPGGMNSCNNEPLVAFPNPVTGRFVSLEGMNNKLYAIYTLEGRYVMGGIVQGNVLDLEMLPAGTYFLQIDSRSIKLIK